MVRLARPKEKAELARDILGLATTKGSGPRYLIIGVRNDGTIHESPVSDDLTQDRIKDILSGHTEPVPSVRYRKVPWQGTTLGIIEVFREPAKIPYRATMNHGQLVVDRVYVRHGSPTEPPTEAELEALIAEGRRARGEDV